MTQVLAQIESLEVASQGSDAFTLKFVEDAEYEFVGGGNAVNAY